MPVVSTEKEDILSVEYLKDRFSYDPETGFLVWRKSRFKNLIGKIAGNYDKDGYRVVWVGNRILRVARLAWLLETGAWPTKEIDHINGKKDDDRFANLREATRSQNAMNRGLDPKNTSGIKGVTWHLRRKKWRVCICVGRRHIHIGFFTNKILAEAAYKKAVAEYHKQFSRV